METPKKLAACDIDEIVNIVAERLGVTPVIGRSTEKIMVDLSDGATPEECGNIVAARLKIPEKSVYHGAGEKAITISRS